MTCWTCEINEAECHGHHPEAPGMIVMMCAEDGYIAASQGWEVHYGKSHTPIARQPITTF